MGISTDQLAPANYWIDLCNCRVTHAALRAILQCTFDVANGAHSRTISTASHKCPSRGAITMLDVIEEAVREGGSMSDPSSSRYRFNAGDTRRARLRIEPTAMMTGIVVLAHAALIGNAMAATEYAVDGLAVGTRLNFGSASYREYKCSPSDQFDGLTWCQKSRADKERRGSYIAAYSLLHSKNGNLSYINRSQEPAFLKPSEVELNIQRYSSKLGFGTHTEDATSKWPSRRNHRGLG